MKKLNKKDIEMIIDDNSNIPPKSIICEMENELLEYKNIEEELGIDLITLFKALTQGIYIKGLNNDYPYWDFELRHIKGIGIVIMWGYCSNLFLKDYGKTWALTKEELEHE